MLKRLLISALLCAPVWGQTTVSQTIIGPDGSLMTGEALIKLSAACRSGSNYAGPQGVYVPFAAGAFSVNLVPTDACPVSGGAGSAWSSVTAYAIGARVSYSGGVYTAKTANTGIVPGADATWLLISPAYTVQWTSSDNWKWTETWVVPTSAIPVTVDSVKVSSAPLPSVPVPGIQGPAGATLDVGTTTTGAAGTNASVVNAGTTSAAVFNFTIPRGNTGATGAVGAQGPIGQTGATGPQGTKGDTGSQGPSGAKGDTGSQGPQGATGAQGPKGDTGSAGAQGAQGPQGPKGDTGSAGAAGSQGAQGVQGPQGAAGATGSAGATGAAGSNGTNGQSVALQVESAGVNCTYAGEKLTSASGTSYVCNGAPGADGATGATGAAGSQGIQGIQGPAGSNGSAGAAGNTVLYGTAAPTTEGVDGNFYIRTSTNYLYGPKAGGVWPAGTSLVGPQGSQGVQGVQGIQGNTGATGAQGSPGAASEYPSWQICNPAGCGSETSNGYYHVMSHDGATFDECGVNLAVAATGSDVWVDVKDSTGTSVFNSGHIVIPNGSTTTVFSSTFTASPYTAAKGAKFQAAVTQNDSGGTAQFAYVRCRIH